MPVDYRKYPKNWKSEIRPRILERAGHKCERCGVDNYAIGYRANDGAFILLARDKESMGMDVETASLVDGYRIITIILTIAHVNDSDPSNCDDGNLEALCQRCHNMLDGKMRAAHAAETRERKRLEAAAANGQVALF